MGGNLRAAQKAVALMPQRLALGTVQFGLPYGIANRQGQVSLAEATAILAQAKDHGLDTLDTAIAYGESEMRLGQIGVSGWRIVSKLPRLPADCTDVGGWVAKSVSASLARLRVPSLDGLLLHHSADLLGPRREELYAAVMGAKAGGLTRKIGVSIYDPQELDSIDARFVLDLVQAPFNVLDRRFATSGWLNRLKERGAEVHTRSVFLQGLLLLSQDERPARFDRWRALWDMWDGWLAQTGLSPTAACLGFVFGYLGIDRVVIGVDSAAQLAQLLASGGHCQAVPAELAAQDLDLINPSRWSSL
jgi:aryl-alcohol dehydrogenase-like predicted oxidoreductase